MFFLDDYFEFIFIRDLEEARSNVLRLDKRADWKTSGASPFGIALRGRIPDEDIDKFWNYEPPYLQGKVIKILEAPEEQPLVFVVPSHTKPIEKTNLSRDLFSHANMATVISKLEISGPSYKWPSITPIEKITFTTAAVPHLTINLNGKLAKKTKVGELLTIALS